MEEKLPLNFNMPAPLKLKFEKIAERHNAKQKWAVCGAAILRLLELSQEQQDEYIRLVKMADAGGEFDKLIKRAEEISKDLRARKQQDQMMPRLAID